MKIPDSSLARGCCGNSVRVHLGEGEDYTKTTAIAVANQMQANTSPIKLEFCYGK
jgi:hypothetical protein